MREIKYKNCELKAIQLKKMLNGISDHINIFDLNRLNYKVEESSVLMSDGLNKRTFVVYIYNLGKRIRLDIIKNCCKMILVNWNNANGETGNIINICEFGDNVMITPEDLELNRLILLFSSHDIKKTLLFENGLISL